MSLIKLFVFPLTRFRKNVNNLRKTLLHRNYMATTDEYFPYCYYIQRGLEIQIQVEPHSHCPVSNSFQKQLRASSWQNYETDGKTSLSLSLFRCQLSKPLNFFTNNSLSYSR